MSFVDSTTQLARAGNPVKPDRWRLLVRNALVLTVFVLGYSPVSLNPATPEQMPFSELNSKELPRFRAVHRYFYRGAAPSFAGMDQLKQMGFKTVIDLRQTPIMIEAERTHLAKLGIEYVSIPMGDWVPSGEKRQRFVQIMSAAANNPSLGPVFLHCSHGSDRTGFLTALWRVEHDHWSVAQAFGEMLHHGFLIHKLSPNPDEQIDH